MGVLSELEQRLGIQPVDFVHKNGVDFSTPASNNLLDNNPTISETNISKETLAKLDELWECESGLANSVYEHVLELKGAVTNPDIISIINQLILKMSTGNISKFVMKDYLEQLMERGKNNGRTLFVN